MNFIEGWTVGEAQVLRREGLVLRADAVDTMGGRAAARGSAGASPSQADSLPVGARVTVGFRPEEASVEVRVTNVLDVFANPPEDGGAVFVLYAATWLAGEPMPGDDADAADFFTRDGLPPLAFRSTQDVIARWADAAAWQTGAP